MKQGPSKVLRYISLLLGMGLFFILIQKIGFANILNLITQLGWKALPILTISISFYALFTFAWQQCFRIFQTHMPFWNLFKIKITGEAVNTLTPLNFIAGDPLRIYLLRKYFPFTQRAAAVVVDRTLHTIAILFIVFIGISIGFLSHAPFPANIRYGIPIALIACIAFTIFVIIHQRRGIFGLLLNLCQRLRIKQQFSEHTLHRFTELDRHIVDFYNNNHTGFLLALFAHISGRCLGVLEIYAFGKLISPDFTFFSAISLTALAPMVHIVFSFVPAAIGILEGAYGASMYLMGFDPAIGIAIQLARRIRSIIWIAIGLFFLGFQEMTNAFDDKLIEKI